MSIRIMTKLAEFCVAHGWNFEVTAAIVETIIVMIPLGIIFALMIYAHHLDSK